MIKPRRTRLARRRRTVGLSQQDLADRLRVDVRSVGRWEAGTGEPQPWLRISLARALEITVGELDQLLSESQHVVPELVAAQPIELSLNTDHNTRNPIGTTTTGGGLAELRIALANSVSGGSLSNALLSDLEETVRRYGLVARGQPASVLFADLTADLAEIQELFARPRPLSTAATLTRVAAQMSGLLCLTLIKLDRRSDFRSWARVARNAAVEAGEPETLSWVLAQEAYGHYYSGDLGEALIVARGSQDAAGATARVGSVLSVALEARILAARGDVHGCERALGNAEDALSRLAPEFVNDSAFGYDEGQLRFHQGNAYTHLGDTANAWRASEQALALCSPDDYMDRTFAQLDHASCLIRAGDAGSGLAYAVEVMSGLSDAQRAGIINLRGRQLLEAIPLARRHALPAAAELRDRLMTPDENEVFEP
ncbi:helix-turn-helix transcriptional regulator [Actinospica sp. MGRD01-02]|uniref:Helix-turn-helix transcriptional regulator n=1 Tax=Actinospica acidithermotolerans TaxID=2828514 RepID=A0A941E8B2_9ACTN|nr:helix-turn-helix transcriptional regulator [Actinospica acidithermotolerans]MBR7825803.1 helix-turn-helix transcriptional regulator [Actinospica acidithermotolerans]